MYAYVRSSFFKIIFQKIVCRKMCVKLILHARRDEGWEGKKGE